MMQKTSSDALPMSPSVDWLGTPAAARHLGVSPRTLYRLIDTGRIPAYEIGRVYRVRTADLDAFLASARVVPGALRHLYAADEGHLD